MKPHIYTYILCMILGLFSIILRFPVPDMQNYKCADATWHSLLTMQAYSETPASVHKFLPIVSLGGADNKGISWGATIPDQYGNYYYTSFSALGYLVPYIFVRIFNLPVNEQSLYIFNSILYLLSFTLTVVLMLKLFDKRLPKWLIVVISALYLFQPEILHSQGIVYWHQSLFQIVFLLQLILFVNLRGKLQNSLFFLLCLIAPYLEWTGYVSNIGLAIALFLEKGITVNRDIIVIKTDRLIKAVLIVALTIASFVIFVIHYLSVVNKTTFYNVLRARFKARAFDAGGATLKALVMGYIDSFGILIVISVIILVGVLIFKPTRVAIKRILSEQHTILVVVLFSLIENIIMRQHAIQYTFDRMKGIFPILIILLMCVAAVYKILTQEKISALRGGGVFICFV